MILSRQFLRRYFILAAIVSLTLAGPGVLVPCTALSDEGVRMKAASVVRPSEIDGWKLAEGPTDYNTTTVFKYMDGAAELFLAYAMKKLTVFRYEKPGRPAITLEVYQMGSPEDAYGLFSFESDDPGAGIGQGSEFGGGLLRFWKGYHFVSIYGESPGEDSEAATLRLGQQIASSIKDVGAPPRILTYLPEGETLFLKNQTWFLHSHILLNQRFFIAHENVLNLANDVDAALARYGGGKERVHLLLVKYPSQTGADSALSRFRSAYMKDAAGKPSVKTENNKWTATGKQGRFVVIVFDAPDEPVALKLIGTTIAALPKEGK